MPNVEYTEIDEEIFGLYNYYLMLFNGKKKKSHLAILEFGDLLLLFPDDLLSLESVFIIESIALLRLFKLFLIF